MSKKPTTYLETALLNMVIHYDPAVAQGKPKASVRAVAKATVEAARACTTLALWAQTQAELGYNPTQAQYAEHMGTSLATVDREMARYRRAFPGEKDPSRHADHVRQVLRERIAATEAPATVQTLAFPQLALTA